MPSASNVVLNTKTYAPSDIVSGTMRWMERSGGYGSSFSPLTLRVVPPAAGVKNYRVTSKLLVPVVATDDSACGCEGQFLRQISADLTVTIAAGSTAAERAEFFLRLSDWVADAAFQAAVENLEPTSW